MSEQREQREATRLDIVDCRARLARSTTGRVALSVGALPVVLPVEYTLVDDSIRLRLGRDQRNVSAWNDSVIAFEVDEVDSGSGLAWTVLVQGTVHAVDHDGHQLTGAARAADDGSDYDVALSCDVICGWEVGRWRELPPTTPPAGWAVSSLV